MALSMNEEKWLHAYVDDELSVEKVLEIEQLLERSEQARREVKRVRSLNKRLSELTFDDKRMSATFEEKLRNQISQCEFEENYSSIKRSPYLSYVAAVAMLLIALTLPFVLKSPPAGIGLLPYIQKSHQGFVRAGRPEFLTTDLSSTVKQLSHYFQTSFGQKSLSVPGAQFIGWCNCRIEGIQDARRLAFRLQNTPVSLYVLKNGAEIPSPTLREQRSGQRLYLTGICGDYQVVKWQSGQLSYVLVAKINQKKMLDVMNGMKF